MAYLDAVTAEVESSAIVRAASRLHKAIQSADQDGSGLLAPLRAFVLEVTSTSQELLQAPGVERWLGGVDVVDAKAVKAAFRAAGPVWRALRADQDPERDALEELGQKVAELANGPRQLA